MNEAFFKTLYPEGIFRVEEQVKVKKEPVPVAPDLAFTEAIKIEYYGENNQKILLLHEDKTDPVLNPGDKDFLGKILAAVRLGFKDVALLNISTVPGFEYSKLEESVDFNKILFFGIDPHLWKPDEKFVKYKSLSSDNIEVLWTDSLSEIQEDKNKKINLWNELKKIFPGEK